MKNTKMVELRGSRTHKVIAKEIGIPVSTYAMIECGHRFPRKALAIRIAEFFSVTVEALFFTLDDHETRSKSQTA